MHKKTFFIIGFTLTLFLFLAGTAYLWYQSQINRKVPPGPALQGLEYYEIEDRIIKENENYLIFYKVPKEANWEGKFMIGNSAVELEPYVGKKVKITRDESRRPLPVGPNLTLSSKQCIAGKCHPIFADDPTKEAEVIDILRIEEPPK